MPAAVFYGQRDVRIERVPIPDCGPCQVRIEPAFVDAHEYLRGATLIPTTPYPLTGIAKPLIIGHEISGVVEKVGAHVRDLCIDDRVVVQPIISDGVCSACKGGYINRCKQQGFYGLSDHGGLAEYMVVSRVNVKRLPESITLELGALIEPLAIGWHAVRLSAARTWHSALVLGAGPIGLATILALKAQGVNPIIVSDVSPRRRHVAKQLGAHVAVNALTEDVVNKCKQEYKGEGVHYAFDTAGVQCTLDQAVAATRPGARITNIAVWGGLASIVPNAFLLEEKVYAGTAVYVEEDIDAVISAIASGAIQPEQMITKKIQLRDLISDGILSLVKDKDNQVKILVALRRDQNHGRPMIC